jgi:hypothetical protein
MVGSRTTSDQISLTEKIVAGGITGALSAFIANPTDLLKVRLQVDGMDAGLRHYRGITHAFISILQQDGVLGLWRGAVPTVCRATVLTAAELASYDEIKGTLLARGYAAPDSLSSVLLTALCSGLLGAVSSCPFDVLKSRIMADSSYRGMADCLVKVYLL